MIFRVFTLQYFDKAVEYVTVKKNNVAQHSPQHI